MSSDLIAGQTALEAVGLGKQYRRGWALRDCSFRLPAGRICGLVGPNGAGKSTLLSLMAGLLTPVEGEVRVFGRTPQDPELRSRFAYVAQDKPLYDRFTVAEMLRFGREFNPGWDRSAAGRVIEQGELPLKARIGSLSGGQRTRVALALALGKRPDLLLLDDPMSDMDPLARHQLMGTLMAEAAEHGTTIVLSTHILAELDGVIDYLLLVDKGAVRLAGEAEEILDAHRLLTGAGTAGQLSAHTVVEERVHGRLLTALIRPRGPVAGEWEISEPTLEEMLLAYLRSPQAPSLYTQEAHVGQAVAA